jgi:hypothetical protein
MGTSPPKPVVELGVMTLGPVLWPYRVERNRKVRLRVSARRQVFLSPDYREEQLRAEFPNPSFESLGWDYPRHLARDRPETGGVLPTHGIRRDAG